MTGNDVEDVIALVGILGDPEPDGSRRIFADETRERYMDITGDAFDHADELPGDELGRMRVFVKRKPWAGHAFTEHALSHLEDTVDGPGMSMWALLPDNRIV